MANMSYCRFENTLSDMVDCAEALETMEIKNGEYGSEDRDGDWESVSEYEVRAIKQMLNVAREIVNALEELEEDS